MARIAGINIPPQQHSEIGLTAIFGIGRTRARKICEACGIAYSKKVKDLTDADLEKIRSLDFRGAKKMPEKLLEHKEMAYLSYQLATIKTDVQLDVAPSAIRLSKPDNEKLKSLFMISFSQTYPWKFSYSIGTIESAVIFKNTF